MSLIFVPFISFPLLFKRSTQMSVSQLFITNVLIDITYYLKKTPKYCVRCCLSIVSEIVETVVGSVKWYNSLNLPPIV